MAFFEKWNSIQAEGLKTMNRTHIHFASGLPGEEGIISGMRKNCDVLIYVDASKCASSGIHFYRSENGVLLTNGIAGSGVLPMQYISHVTDKSGTMLFEKQCK